MPPNTVKVDRSTRWGNSYRIGGSVYRERGFGKIRDATDAVDMFRRREVRHLSGIAQLRGKNLACWCQLCEAHRDGRPFDVECPDCAPCHADVIGEVANRPIEIARR